MKKAILIFCLVASIAHADPDSINGGFGIDVDDPFSLDPVISLGNLTNDWVITGGGGIVLSSPLANFKMADADGFFHGTLAASDLSANRFYTFPNKTGVVALTSDILKIPQSDLEQNICVLNTWFVDIGGPTVELCHCLKSNSWACIPMTLEGPID